MDRYLPLEAQSIRLSTEAGYVVISNVYWPPSDGVDKREKELEALSRLFDDDDSIVVVGDFNAKSPVWGSPCSDDRGRSLTGLVSDSEFVVLNDGRPTRVDDWYGSMTHIDLALGVSKRRP